MIDFILEVNHSQFAPDGVPVEFFELSNCFGEGVSCGFCGDASFFERDVCFLKFVSLSTDALQDTVIEGAETISRSAANSSPYTACASRVEPTEKGRTRQIAPSP